MPDVENLEPLPPGVVRALYFQGCPPETRLVLEERGYDVVEVLALPRGDDESDGTYYRAVLAGLVDRTIEGDDSYRRNIELALRTLGMLGQTNRNVSLRITLGDRTLGELLDWEKDRHTLAGNSTVQSAQRTITAKLPEEEP